MTQADLKLVREYVKKKYAAWRVTISRNGLVRAWGVIEYTEDTQRNRDRRVYKKDWIFAGMAVALLRERAGLLTSPERIQTATK